GCDKAMHARLRGVPRRRRAITDAQASDTPRALEVSRARFKSAQALILSSPGRPPYRMFYYGAGFARGAQRRNRALMADLRFTGQADMGDRLVSTSWVAIDPKRTKTRPKSRSAGGLGIPDVLSFGRARQHPNSIQNNSGLPQGPAGASGAS